MTSPFGQVADAQLSGAQKARERGKIRVEARRVERERVILMPTPLEKKQQDAAVQMKLYRAWRRSIRTEILAECGPQFADLLRLIRNLEWTRAEDVVDFVRGARWLRRADDETRFETLRLIDGSLGRARVRHGLSELDDGLPGEPLTPFLKIRKMLMHF